MQNEGPQIKTIPAQSEKVCNGCKYLDEQPGLRGHEKVTNSYTCTHENYKNENANFTCGKGKIIHFMHEGDCQTPGWCPLLQVINKTMIHKLFYDKKKQQPSGLIVIPVPEFSENFKLTNTHGDW